jgi:Fe-S-cluster-containing hydrogenase component 2
MYFLCYLAGQNPVQVCITKYYCSVLCVKRNTEALLEASREVGLEVNTEKSKYMVMSCHHIQRQNCNLLITSKF